MQQKLEIFENAMLPDDYKPGGEKFQQENLSRFRFSNPKKTSLACSVMNSD